MCVILVGKITPTLHKLALETNGDGFSVFTKEFGLQKAPNSRQVKRALGKYGIWHYRIATSGKIDENNIHPFEVCKGEYYLYHNGVLGDGIGNKSDTALLAELMYDKPIETVKSILKAVSESQRFILVRKSNPHDFELFGEWEVNEGVLMSHRLYARRYTGRYSKNRAVTVPTILSDASEEWR